MTIKKHEIWMDYGEHGEELPSCVLAGPLGDGARALLGPKAHLVHVFDAGSHFEAMTIYYRFWDWGQYTTEHAWDREPYPKDG